MSTLAAVGRTVVSIPTAILRSGQTKLSIVLAGYLGLTVGAHGRAAGRRPAPVIERVRNDLITPAGRLAETDADPPPSPVEEAAVDVAGEWITQPVVTAPEGYNAAVEQTVVVPALRVLLSLTELTAGVGYWLAGFVPPQVIGYGGVVVFGVFTLLHLRSIVLRTAEVVE